MYSEKFIEDHKIKEQFNHKEDNKTKAGVNIHQDGTHIYVDDSYTHKLVIGNTGSGKTQCCTLPFITNCFEKGESLVVIDPKGESHRKTSNQIPSNYQNFCIDFRNPNASPSKWNVLKFPYDLLKSDNPVYKSQAETFISDFWTTLYPASINQDPFWVDNSINLVTGLTRLLIEHGSDYECTMDNIGKMMISLSKELTNDDDTGTYLHKIYKHLPDNHPAKVLLTSFNSAPGRTARTIVSSVMAGFKPFLSNSSLMNLLSLDTIDLWNFDVTKPFIITIIIPDETDIYDSIAGFFISQFTQFLYIKAYELGGELPIRVNLILEELGSIGKSIPNLANLVTAGRSRNIRLLLVLQSLRQLDEIYGVSKAKTINSCIGTTIAFSTNCYETLDQLSKRCGNVVKNRNGSNFIRPLLTSNQIGAMDKGQALVLVGDKYKFVSQLPFFYSMNQKCSNVDPVYTSNRKIIKSSVFKTERFERKITDDLSEKRRKRMKECINQEKVKPISG